MRDYNSQISNIEQGTFTPLVFSGTGGMGRSCLMFIKELSELISTKQKDGLIVVTYGFRCKLVMQYYKFAYYAFEGTESQIMNMKNSMKYR